MKSEAQIRQHLKDLNVLQSIQGKDEHNQTKITRMILSWVLEEFDSYDRFVVSLGQDMREAANLIAESN